MARSVVDEVAASERFPWYEEMISRLDHTSFSGAEDKKDTDIMDSMHIPRSQDPRHCALSYIARHDATYEDEIDEVTTVLLVPFDLYLYPIHFIIGQDIYSKHENDILSGIRHFKDMMKLPEITRAGRERFGLQRHT
jgi:hypothetical protein